MITSIAVRTPYEINCMFINPVFFTIDWLHIYDFLMNTALNQVYHFTEQLMDVHNSTEKSQ